MVKDNILCRIWEDIQTFTVHPSKNLSELEQLHSSPIGGHLGIRKTAEKVQCRFYWKRDTEDWCRTCENCQSRKSPSQSRRAPMQTILPGRPFQRVAMDILGPFEKQLRKSSVDSIGLAMDGKETLKTGAEPVKTVIPPTVGWACREV